jgi:membrane protein YqaA with SNARE-associated domain
MGSFCHRRNRLRIFGVPLDPVVATYVYQNRSHALLYPVMAAAGSAAGYVILYWIGYKGGEALLIKRMSRAKFERIRASFDRHEFWALMVPSMLPPPFPFKAVVLAAHPCGRYRIQRVHTWPSRHRSALSKPAHDSPIKKSS